MSNPKKYVESTVPGDERYKACRLKWNCALLLPQRKIRLTVICFFGVGGSGRRPLESADPGLGVAVG